MGVAGAWLGSAPRAGGGRGMEAAGGGGGAPGRARPGQPQTQPQPQPQPQTQPKGRELFRSQRKESEVRARRLRGWGPCGRSFIQGWGSSRAWGCSLSQTGRFRGPAGVALLSCDARAPRSQTQLQSFGGLAQNLSKVWGTHLDPGLPTTPPTCPKTPLGCCAPAAPVPGWGSRTGIGSPGSDVPGPRKATAGPPRAKHGKISLSHPGAAGGGAPSPQKRTVPPTREFGVCFAPPPLSLSGLGLHALLRIPPRL